MLLGVLFLAWLTDEIPRGTTNTTVSTVTCPSPAVLTTGVVTLSTSLAPTARMADAHVIGDRMLKVSTADVTHLTVTSLPPEVGIIAHRHLVGLLLVLAHSPHLLKLLLAILLGIVTVSSEAAATLLAPAVEAALLNNIVKTREHHSLPKDD